MNPNRFLSLLKTIFIAATAVGLLTFAFVFDYSSRYHSVVWTICAVVIFLIAIIFFRITKVNWPWSLLAGSLAVAVLSVLSFLINYLLHMIILGLIAD